MIDASILYIHTSMNIQHKDCILYIHTYLNRELDISIHIESSISKQHPVSDTSVSAFVMASGHLDPRW